MQDCASPRQQLSATKPHLVSRLECMIYIFSVFIYSLTDHATHILREKEQVKNFPQDARLPQVKRW